MPLQHLLTFLNCIQMWEKLPRTIQTLHWKESFDWNSGTTYWTVAWLSWVVHKSEFGTSISNGDPIISGCAIVTVGFQPVPLCRYRSLIGYSSQPALPIRNSWGCLSHLVWVLLCISACYTTALYRILSTLSCKHAMWTLHNKTVLVQVPLKEVLSNICIRGCSHILYQKVQP